MQENRAFDHYFGTMAGVRGFNDANLQTNNGVPVWKQLSPSKEAQYISPWYINYLGGTWPEATQCMLSGSNSWYNNHAAWNHGTNDHWAVNNTPYSIGFYKRQDLPTQWSLAENWVIGDMYQEAVVASTSPNRVVWQSGSINVPGGPQAPDQGGNPYIDNNETPGCEKGGINCYPLKWKTAAEHYEDAGVDWQVFQDADNFDDNPLAWFKQFQDAKKDSSLYNRGIKGQSLNTFYARAANGTLPEVSYINKIAEAIVKSPKYSKTALIVSYDETGGWFDHVDPFRSPDGTAGEWLDDPYDQVGRTFAGPGFRVPFYIISPWTRKGGVYTEHADHNSQLLFIEKWQAAKGRNVTTKEMVAWRRENMGDLVGAFDFENPDTSVPNLPNAPEPHKDSKGNYDGSSHCKDQYPKQQPPVPYKGEGVITDMPALVEKGFKPIRGKLTEGRFLVLEMNGFALTAGSRCGSKDGVCLTKATDKHETAAQRWVAHVSKLGGTEFTFSSSVDGQYICESEKLCGQKEKAMKFNVGFTPSKGYCFKMTKGGQYMVASSSGVLSQSGSQGDWKGAADGAHDIGRVAGQADGLLPQTSRAHFRGKCPAELPGGELEDEGPEHGEAGLRHGDGVAGRPHVEDTDEDEDEAHARHAPDVDGAAAEPGHEDEPVHQTPDERQAGAAEGERVRGARAETHLREEVGAVVREADAAEDLAGEDDAGNLGAAQLGALEAVPVARADAQLLLEVVGVDDHGEGLARVHVGRLLGLEAPQRCLGLVEPAHAHEVPGGLGREVDEGHEEDGPHPLDGKGDLVPPLVGARGEALEDAGGDELADDEAHVGVRGHVGAQRHGEHLGGVGGRRGGEDAPGEAAEDLADDQRGEVGREEDDEDEGRQREERAELHAPRAVLGDEVAADEAADDGADVGALRQAGLPRWRELVAGRGLGRDADKVAVSDEE
ncbi:non-hemolytic phospholipase C precursor [Purpureocillium lavendulum]|uniref:Non-hemolytic phospholipase C n=1 Tax=Purpureocillium lavendulum TaxID=1247861 RepID=A0AB34FSG8_9HYPO|nr:non-hemolytic phospholipase C precursor [Purpureocillium lavendulum]